MSPKAEDFKIEAEEPQVESHSFCRLQVFSEGQCSVESNPLVLWVFVMSKKSILTLYTLSSW